MLDHISNTAYSQSYSPWLKKDVDELERVQRRTAKMVTGFQKLN